MASVIHLKQVIELTGEGKPHKKVWHDWPSLDLKYTEWYSILGGLNRATPTLLFK